MSMDLINDVVHRHCLSLWITRVEMCRSIAGLDLTRLPGTVGVGEIRIRAACLVGGVTGEVYSRQDGSERGDAQSCRPEPLD